MNFRLKYIKIPIKIYIVHNCYFKITVVVPAIILEDNITSEMESNLSLDALQIEEKSRRFSQLPPGLSMSFYPDFFSNSTLILSKSYPDSTVWPQPI